MASPGTSRYFLVAPLSSKSRAEVLLKPRKPFNFNY